MTWERTSEISVTATVLDTPVTGTHVVGERPAFFFTTMRLASVHPTVTFRSSRIDGSTENIQKRYADITGQNTASSVATSRADGNPLCYYGSVHARLGKSPIILYRHTYRVSGGNHYVDRVISMSAGMLTVANRMAFTGRNAIITGFIFEDV